MARQARGEYLDPNSIQIVHAVNRCVRRAFLCGQDPYSGESFEHRRQWIRERLEFLASIFAVDCLTYAVMSNHVHLVLRSRPDIIRNWSDREVAVRWLRLCPMRRSKNGTVPEPNEFEVNAILSNPRRLAELRVRLSDISWFMAKTAEKIARMANREDNCTGRFWEGRYKAQLILDEASLLACAVYVDLNPIRAAIAETPEKSEFTGAKDRIDDLQARLPETIHSEKARNNVATKKLRRNIRWERSRRRAKSGWMSPLQIDERADPIGPDASTCGRRSSLKGFLSMTLTKYLELLDWTGRQLRSGKRGNIPSHFAPILSRLGIEGSTWCELVSGFGKLFKRCAGSAKSVNLEATRRDQSWLQAPGACYLD